MLTPAFAARTMRRRSAPVTTGTRSRGPWRCTSAGGGEAEGFAAPPAWTEYFDLAGDDAVGKAPAGGGAAEGSAAPPAWMEGSSLRPRLATV